MLRNAVNFTRKRRSNRKNSLGASLDLRMTCILNHMHIDSYIQISQFFLYFPHLLKIISPNHNLGPARVLPAVQSKPGPLVELTGLLDLEVGPDDSMAHLRTDFALPHLQISIHYQQHLGSVGPIAVGLWLLRE